MRFVLLAAALSLAACAPAPTAPCPAPVTLPATVPTPPYRLEETDAAFRKTVEAKDGDAAAFFFADENPPGAPASASLGEIMRTSLKALAADPNGKASFRPTGAPAASATGDLAYTIGVMNWTATHPDTKSPLALSSAYILIWRLQADGAWKIVRVASTEVPYESPYRRYEN